MKNKKLLKYFMALGIGLMITHSFMDTTCAGPGESSSPPSIGGKVLQPNVMPTPRPPIFIKYRWSPDDVIKAFNSNGIETRDKKPVTAEDYSLLPAKAKDAAKFIMTSDGEDIAGCILSFDRKDDMERITDHYRKLNKKSELLSWTFTKDNVLVVLKGEIPGGRAKQVEQVLKDMKK